MCDCLYITGWLGLAMFFTPIAFTILVNVFFYLTTGQAINRMSTYGRIHHKMKFK
jgi:G protein-coupled receptor Mth (Methuselah protein)